MSRDSVLGRAVLGRGLVVVFAKLCHELLCGVGIESFLFDLLFWVRLGCYERWWKCGKCLLTLVDV